MTKARSGAVIFAAHPKQLAEFYAATTGLPVEHADKDHVVLASASFELVIHQMHGGVPEQSPPVPRRDTAIKPFFVVASLATAREKAAALGGMLEPAQKEWSARGFRACEAVDPEGNVIQFREEAV
jgi:predicted enzyme related to lactoylglutathione lyase